MNIADLTNAEGLITRSFAIRSNDAAKREFTGIGVPYGETFNPGFGWSERFDPGAVDGVADGAKIYWRHGEVIGRMTAGRDTEAGYEITGKISDTVQGRDAWTLLTDGAVDSLSIGFQPVEWRVEKNDDGTETIIHTKVKTREFSLAPDPAYTTAKVSATRSAPNTKEAPVDTTTAPDTLTRSDLDPFNEAIADLRRSIDKAAAGQSPAGPVIPQFRSIGDYVKAVADGDETALNFHRDMTGGVYADGLNDIAGASWLGEYFHMVEERRRVFNTFGKKSLPPKGMKVSYGKITSTDIKMGEQLKEGDNLPGPSKVKLGTEAADVHTIGGWTEASFQSIQRSEIGVVDTMWKGMLMRYARETEVRVQNDYLAVIAANIAKTTRPENPDVDAALAIAAGADSFDWLDLMLDAAMLYEERGFKLEGLHASIDQFKALNRLTDGDGRRLMNVYGTGVNQVGELNLSTVDATLGKVPVQLIGGRKTRGVLSFFDPVAIETLESPGAPFQLQDENIINLTKQLSLYGYIAVTNPFPEAIVPVQVTA